MEDVMDDPKELDRLRSALQDGEGAGAVFAFGELVDRLGYADARAMDAAGLDFGELVEEAVAYYLCLPGDAAALNNAGALLSNQGRRREARAYVLDALRLSPDDRNAHQNLRILDILDRKPRSQWHRVPEDAVPAGRSFVAYFDPHGM
jgi:tetratricopeptide (TPR) repeat protein